MAISFTTMSRNGQVVIPNDIRDELGLKRGEKFLVVTDGKRVMLTPADAIARQEIELLEKLAEAEEQIKKGRYVFADTSMSPEEITRRLLNPPWKSSSQNGSRSSSRRSKMKRS